jgi:hypothetical protein
MLQFRHLILKDVKYLNFLLILYIFAISIVTKTSAQESLSKLSEADRQVYNEYQNQISRFASVSNHYELARYYTLAGNLLWKNKLHEDAIRFLKGTGRNRILGTGMPSRC